jgi:hypothetical protein
MSHAREQLAADLTPLLTDYTILPDPRAVGSLDPGKRGTVQIVRDNFRRHPIAPQASYLEQLHVWVLSHLKEQPAAENDLDDLAREVTDALQSLGKAAWDEARRMRHPEGHHAYRITATYITDKE